MELNDYLEHEGVDWNEPSGVGINPFKRSYSPTQAKRPTQERLVCSRTALCKGCPYPSHGFVCWGRGGDCMRGRIAVINHIKEDAEHEGDTLQ